MSRLSHSDSLFQVAGLDCIFSASQTAVTANRKESLRTRSLYTEILFNLSPHNKIGPSLQQFGAGDQHTSVLAVTVETVSLPEELRGSGPAEIENFVASELQPQSPALIQNEVKGEVVSLDLLSEMKNDKDIIKYFGITEQELKLGTITESCLTRVACKGFL